MTIDFVSATIALFALVVSVLTYRYNRGKLRILRAIELAKEYAVLMKDITVIVNIAQVYPEITNLITKNSLTEESEFTVEELNKIYTKDELDSLISFFNFETVNKNLLLQIYMHTKIDAVHIAPDADHWNISINEDLLETHYSTKVTNLLNDLECFAMNFNCNVADTRIIYQSIHQSFMEVIRILYQPIARYNDSDSEKFYTNIIALYRRFILMKESQTKRFKKIEMRYRRQKRVRAKGLQPKL